MIDYQYYDKLIVSSSPHIVSKLDTQRTMVYVIIALLPSLAASAYVYGLRVLLLAAVSMACAVFLEWGWNKLMKKEQTVRDFSAALTGLLLALNVPYALPIWICIVGDFVAIVVAKQLFGGIGKNVTNPAITARIVLLISFTHEMTVWPSNRLSIEVLEFFERLGIDVMSSATVSPDAVSSATPLSILAEGGIPSKLNLFLNFAGGSSGEVSAILLILGGVFLVWKRVINPITPLSIVGTVFIFSFIYYTATGSSNVMDFCIFHSLAGGLLLGAIYMATDYATTPILPLGKFIFGVGVGIFTMIIRLWGQYPEGVSFAILIMNCLTPYIDQLAERVEYGGIPK